METSPERIYRVDDSFGGLETRALVQPSIQVIHFQARLKKDLHVRHYDDKECTSVNCCYALSGDVRSKFFGLGEDLTLRKGSQNFIYKPAYGDDHFFRAGRDPVSLLHVCIDRNYFIDLLNGNDQWCDEIRSCIFEKRLVIGSHHHMLITPSMHQIIFEIIHCPLKGSLRDLLIEAKILELTAYQLHQFFGNSFSCTGKFTQSDRDVFYSLKEYLQENFSQDHSLRSLSRMFGVNEFRLKKGFKDYFGQTVFSFIHSLRMENAKTLLFEKGLTVNEVAGIAGYKNPNHFSVAFKKNYGIVPSSLKTAQLS